MKKLVFIALSIIVFTSCTSVESGHKGVQVEWGGKTNLNEVYNEGMHYGLKWLFDDMVEYDVRETTVVEKYEFNDKNNMTTVVEISLDFNLSPKNVNQLHVKINDVVTKMEKTLKSAGKEVVPQYSAVELNINKRTEAEQKLSDILSKELPEFFVDFARVQITDVDIPKSVADLAEKTAVQLGKNELAKKKEAEQIALAQARIAKATGDADAEIARAKGEYEAAKYDAKTKEVLSAPKMLKLKELEVELEWAKQGKSKYGNNNVFGSQTAIVRGLK